MEKECSEKQTIRELLKLQKESEERWHAIGILIRLVAWIGIIMLPLLVMSRQPTDVFSFGEVVAVTTLTAFIAVVCGAMFFIPDNE